jgi:hypothetical protein
MEQKKKTLLILVIDANSKQGTPINWKTIFTKARKRRFDVAEKRAQVCSKTI